MDAYILLRSSRLLYRTKRHRGQCTFITRSFSLYQTPFVIPAGNSQYNVYVDGDYGGIVRTCFPNEGQKSCGNEFGAAEIAGWFSTTLTNC